VLGNWEGADADAMDVQVADTNVLPDPHAVCWTAPAQPELYMGVRAAGAATILPHVHAQEAFGAGRL